VDVIGGEVEIAQTAKTWYVAPQGDDAHPGTFSEPFRTIQKGVDAAAAGDTVWVRQGVYRESVRIERSGKEGRPMVLRNYPGEEPVVEVDSLAVGRGQGKGFLLQAAQGHQVPVGWTVIEGFEIRGAHDGIKMYNAHSVVLRNNRILEARNQGILGNGYQILIEGNTIARNGLSNGDPQSNKQHGIYLTGTRITIQNNVFYANQAYGIQVAGYTRAEVSYLAGEEYSGARHWIIRHNTFAFHKVRGAIVLWKEGTRQCAIQDNIFYQNAPPDITDYTHKDSGHRVTGNFSGDPLFVAPEHLDFRLRPGSPAAGKGAFPQPLAPE
jgi:hypothetical protein